MNRVLLPLTAPIEPPEPCGDRPVSLSGPTMGVTWSVKALAPDGLADEGLRRDLQALVNALVLQMSPWERQSDISRFNRAPPGTWVQLPPAFFHVLSAALAWAERSGGAFDPTLGRLVDLWGFGPPGPVSAPPSRVAVAEALGEAGWRCLQIDGDGRRARQPGGLSLDLSGIAKGYAVDALSERLLRHGVFDALVEIGGECRGRGVKANGEPWWVTVEDPPDRALDRPPIVCGLHDLAIATSGDYRRFLPGEGRRLSHTLDSRTGAPAVTDVVAVTVVRPTAMEADVLATVLTVLGSQAGMTYATKNNIAARFVVAEGDRATERLSPLMRAMLA